MRFFIILTKLIPITSPPAIQPIGTVTMPISIPYEKILLSLSFKYVTAIGSVPTSIAPIVEPSITPLKFAFITSFVIP